MNPWVLVGLIVIGFTVGWGARAVKCDGDMADYQLSLVDQQNDQRDLTRRVEAAAIKNTEESTGRVDVIDQQHQVEVRYVEKEVIKYRSSPVAGKCKLPAEWVRLYNESGADTDRVSTAGEAGPQTAGPSSTVR